MECFKGLIKAVEDAKMELRRRKQRKKKKVDNEKARGWTSDWSNMENWVYIRYYYKKTKPSVFFIYFFAIICKLFGNIAIYQNFPFYCSPTQIDNKHIYLFKSLFIVNLIYRLFLFNQIDHLSSLTILLCNNYNYVSLYN